MRTITPNQPDSCSVLIVNHIMGTEHTIVAPVARDEAIDRLQQLCDWGLTVDDVIGVYFRVTPDRIELHWYAVADENVARPCMEALIDTAQKIGWSREVWT